MPYVPEADDESLPNISESESLPSTPEPLSDELPSTPESLPEITAACMPIPGNVHAGTDFKDDLPRFCCKEMCANCIQVQCSSEMRQWQATRSAMSNDELNDFVYNLLRIMTQTTSQKPVHSRPGKKSKSGCQQSPGATSRQFRLFGQPTCRAGFIECIGIGNSRLAKLQSWLKAGHPQPPRDLRHTRSFDQPACRVCHAALQWAYDVLAETFNSSDVRPAYHEVNASAPELAVEPGASDPTSGWLPLPTLDGFREWVHGPGVTVSSSAATSGEVKWLPPMSLIDLFDLCKSRMESSPTFMTFLSCYHESWSSCLRFRSHITQSKCNDCERFKALRRQATTPEGAEAVRAKYYEHLKSTYHDRAVDERIQQAALDATTTPAGVTVGRSILNMDMDAMEAMKFKCPRNLSAAKSMANLWRPQQGMIGALVDGCDDHFWLVPPDIGKNANLSTTLTADLLQHTVSELKKRGVPLPQKFRVHTDNATNEAKNQTFMKFMAWMAWKQFKSTEMTQFRPGHSHGRIDQAFSIIGTALNKQAVLETPDDFKRVIETSRKKPGKCCAGIRVVQVGAVYNWDEYFECLGVGVHNHTQNQGMTTRNEEACHVFRFFQRAELQKLGVCMIDESPHTIFEDPPAPDDIILVTKLYLGSETYAQRPEVFCPGARFRALPVEGPTTIAKRIKFSDCQEKEFLKTARTIEKPPWNLDRSAGWLRGIVKANKEGESNAWVLPDISWVVRGNVSSAKPVSIACARPTTTPVAVSIQDTQHKEDGIGKCTLKRKQPLTAASQKRKKPLTQRDRNLVEPSAAQSVAGAPLAAVNEAGAPENVAAPPAVRNTNGCVRKRPAAAPQPHMSTRMRTKLLSVPTEPNLGCTKCRGRALGCSECKETRDRWLFLHRGWVHGAVGGA